LVITLVAALRWINGHALTQIGPADHLS